MAHGDYYNPANKSVTDGTVVYADDVNKINTAVDSALEQVAYDLDVLEASLEAGGLSAKNWATEDQGTRPDPILDLYSAKAYALEAKDWASASGTITEASTGAALAGSASAKTKAAEAANSALAASGSASSAAGSAITATTKAGEALNSANAAALSETNAGNSAISAAASAANLPNATTAGANKLLTTNSSGNGWEYPSITTAGKAILDDVSAAAQRTTLGLGNVANVDTTNANNITSGTLAEARIPSTIARDSEVAALFSSRSRKNLLINGGFDVWQDGPGPFTTGNVYTADGWVLTSNAGDTCTLSREATTPGTQGGHKYFARLVVSASTSAINIVQPVEDVRTTAGRTVTASILCRANAAKNISIGFSQTFGTGGSVSAMVAPIGVQKVAIGTSLAVVSVTAEIPSISGKTIGTDENSCLNLAIWISAESSFNPYTDSLGLQTGTFEFYEAQLEFGDAATDFEYRHPAEELALCQRYYETGTNSIRKIFYQLTSTSARSQAIQYKVTKRVMPTCVVGSFIPEGHDGTPGVLTAISTTDEFITLATWTGGTVGRAFSGLFTWTADARL